jgi:hypothetical protein
MLIQFISVASLSLVGLICALGIFHPAYNDTLLERIGLAIVGCWSLLRASAIEMHHVDLESINELLLYAGLSAYAVGSGWAKWQVRSRPAWAPTTQQRQGERQ